MKKELNDLPEWAGPLRVGGKIRGSRREHLGGKTVFIEGPGHFYQRHADEEREAVGKTVRPRVVRTGRRGFSVGQE